MKKVEEESESKREKVLKLLKEHKGEGFTRDEIEKRTGVSVNDVTLYRFPQLEKIEKTKHQERGFYHYELDWNSVLFFVGIAVAAIGFLFAAFH